MSHVTVEGNQRNEFLSVDTTEKENGKAYCQLLVLTFKFLQCVTIKFYSFYLMNEMHFPTISVYKWFEN